MMENSTMKSKEHFMKAMNNNISLYRIPYTDYNMLEIKINDILKEVQHDC